MSWSGTVRCGNCYGKGHNRRSCPDLVKRMEQRLADNPDDYYAKAYFEKKKGAKIRKCSFCKEQGHNRATCPNLKTAKNQWTKANAAYRQEVLDHMTANGIGVGTLLELPETYLGNGKGYLRGALGIVTDVNWNLIRVDDWGNYPPPALIVRVCGASSATVKCRVPVDATNAMQWDSRSTMSSIKAPCTGSYLAPPSEWSSGNIPKPKFKELMEGQQWGQQYDYDSREYVESTCGVVLRAKKWEAKHEESKKENK